MNCEDILELAPLYLSGELDEAERARFRAHLAGCWNCARMVARQEQMDALLRDAFASDLSQPAAALKSIQKTRSVRLLTAGAIAATIAAAAILGIRILRPSSVFSDAAEDHRVEVVNHQPRRWRTDPAEIQKIAQHYGFSEVGVLTAVLPGYKLEHAKMCGIAGKPALHLVYTNGNQEFSVFVLRRTGLSTENFRDVSLDHQHLTAFENDRFDTIVTTAGSSMECLELARLASTVL
jgi:hypothetical protein